MDKPQVIHNQHFLFLSEKNKAAISPQIPRKKKAVAKTFFTKNEGFRKTIYPQLPVETCFPPFVQTLSYFLFIKVLYENPLWIKTKQL